MPKNISSRDVAWILGQVGITLKRHGKEDVFEGVYNGVTRVVIVPRNKRSIPQGTLSSIWRQAGMNKSLAVHLWQNKK
jgi:predicted RNA binding protein YcfA (HicA-like mRNA interferase family)